MVSLCDPVQYLNWRVGAYYILYSCTSLETMLICWMDIVGTYWSVYNEKDRSHL